MKLNFILGSGCLVICDCEGYELELLDPASVPMLTRSDMLVELHDDIRPGATATILNRFKTTHRRALAEAVDRQSSDYPSLELLPPEDRTLALTEMRSRRQRWAFLTANSEVPFKDTMELSSVTPAV